MAILRPHLYDKDLIIHDYIYKYVAIADISLEAQQFGALMERSIAHNQSSYNICGVQVVSYIVKDTKKSETKSNGFFLHAGIWSKSGENVSHTNKISRLKVGQTGSLTEKG